MKKTGEKFRQIMWITSRNLQESVRVSVRGLSQPLSTSRRSRPVFCKVRRQLEVSCPSWSRAKVWGSEGPQGGGQLLKTALIKVCPQSEWHGLVRWPERATGPTINPSRSQERVEQAEVQHRPTFRHVWSVYVWVCVKEQCLLIAALSESHISYTFTSEGRTNSYTLLRVCVRPSGE